MTSLKQLLRRLLRTPGFAAVTVLTLALGIGANTAIFSVVNGVLLKPLPYPDSESLVGIWHTAPGVVGLSGDVNCSPTMFFTYREQNQTFQEIGLWGAGGAQVIGNGDPEQVRALLVTPGTLNALGVKPVLGRWFSDADGQPGARQTVILTDGYWRRKTGGDASIVGRSLTIDGTPRDVIGVMPARFHFSNNPELILVYQLDRNRIFLGQFSYQGIARLKPGVTIEQANQDVARMLPGWLKSWPPPPTMDRSLFENARIAPKLKTLKQEVVGDAGDMLWVLMGTVGMVLLIACANVANLLLVRAEGRQQEFAIRCALGASRREITVEMLRESTVLGFVGGIAGVGLAYAGVRLLVAAGPTNLPRLAEISIDVPVLVFAAGVSLFSALLFGCMPALKYGIPRVTAALRAGSRSMTASRERHRARNLLVVTQVALALILLVGSGLMIRTFDALRRVQPGFTGPEEIQLVRINIPETQVKEPEFVMRMENQILDKIAAIPGVQAAAFASSAPLEGFASTDIVVADGKTYAPGQVPPLRRFRFVTPNFYRAMGTPLVAGREFTWTDLYEKRHVAMVSENMAKELWGSPAGALGRRVRQGLGDDPWREIVGVVGDVHDNGLQQEAPKTVYWPALMDKFWLNSVNVIRGGAFIIRSRRAATEGFLTEIRQAVWSVNPSLPVFLVRTMKDLYDQSMSRTSFTLAILAIAGVMATVLGVVGIYGVLSYSVSQRQREIGIRIALGAEGAAVRRMFLRQGLLLAIVGLSVGAGGAALLARLMQAILFGVSPFDPLTYAAVPIVLALASAAASYIPARRATTVDPVDALRAE